MDLTFDISQDELPIFMAEVDEQLQALDVDLVRLEKSSTDQDLLQRLFRAAHTLKGMAGFIGHHRMVSLTHALETAFDGLRKSKLSVSTSLVDLCLEAIDGLKLLRGEVQSSSASDLDVTVMVSGFEKILGASSPAPAKIPAAKVKSNGGNGKTPAAAPLEISKPTVVTAPAASQTTYKIVAEITPNSFASAARAFQVLLALQNIGEILTIDPSQERIETAAPVSAVRATVSTDKSASDVQKALQEIPELSSLQVGPADTPDAIPAIPTGNSQAANPQSSAAVVSTPEGSTAEAKSPLPVEKENTHLPQQAPSPAQADERLKSGASKSNMTVRTTVERLDALMNLVGELITDRNQLNQIKGRIKTNAENNIEALSETVGHLARITDQLQEEVMRIRMLPMSNVFNKFPRLVRDLAQKTGKQIELVIHGEETELDRSMIEEINDPLIHLLRNSVDHGIETPAERLAAGKPEQGTVTLNARHEQGRIILTVEDDGRGIDPDVIRRSAVYKGLISEEEAAAISDAQAVDFIFRPGFSTARVVSDISGRGVGLDIVQTNIHRVNGTLQIETKVGKGTQFIITLPLTLAIVPSLLVKVAEAEFAIPLVMVTETLRLKVEDIKTIRGRPVTVVRDSILPLMYLSEVLDLSIDEAARKFSFVVVVYSGKQRMGLVVDSLCGEEEVVVKSLGNLIGNLPGISSAAILGDGKIALIIDVPGLFKSIGDY